jgi:Response regulator containing a CheY-like receiver domain and an HTH DNA-binding domain
MINTCGRFEREARLRQARLGAALNIHLIVQLLVLAGEAKSADELIKQLEALLASYRFDFYELAVDGRLQEEAGGPVLAERWPGGWRETYAAKRYALVDPAARMLVIAQRPYRVRDALPLMRNDPRRSRVQRMMQDAARHGLHDGYIFPIHGRTGLLGHMAVGGRPVDLSPVEITLFEAVAKRIMWRMFEVRGMASDLEKPTPVDIPLTRRELEVVSHLTQGLTSPEIAKALQISSHTVDWYINGLQEKMKARNRQHVVALALRKGFVA